MRVKVPESIAPRDSDGNVIYGATPWHQDSGVVNASADDTDMLTVWFPLMDTDAENGCLQVIPGSHRGEVLTHCGGRAGPEHPLHDPARRKHRARRAAARRRLPLPAPQDDPRGAAQPQRAHPLELSTSATTRPVSRPAAKPFPGFVARSQRDPDAVLHDASRWRPMWLDARAALADQPDPEYNRWSLDDEACA